MAYTYVAIGLNAGRKIVAVITRNQEHTLISKSQ